MKDEFIVAVYYGKLRCTTSDTTVLHDICYFAVPVVSIIVADILLDLTSVVDLNVNRLVAP